MVRSIISRFLSVLSTLVRRTNWWNNRYSLVGQFMPQPLFRASYVRNYESICLGGESAAYSIQLENGLNLSSGKTTLQLVYDVLKFYHSYLKKKGIVLLSFSPYEVIQQPQLTYIDYSRFIKPLPIMEKERVGDYYSPVIYLLDTSQIPSMTYKYYNRPYLYEPWNSLKSLIWDEKEDKRKSSDDELVVSPQMKKKAEAFIKNYLCDVNFGEVKSILNNICSFCKERDYHPVLLINPVHGYLAERIPSSFYVFLEQLSSDVEVWDYSQDTDLMDYSLYQDFELMNKKGRELYSNKLKVKIMDKYNRLGGGKFLVLNGLPPIGFGTWPLKGRVLEDVMKMALDVGYRMFDTADNYGNEEAIGNVISQNIVKREELRIVTKISDEKSQDNRWSSVGKYFYKTSPYMQQHSCKEVVNMLVEQSLRKLRTEYIDCLIIHWPYPDYLLEIWDAMMQLQKEGKLLSIGVSNCQIRHLESIYKNFGIYPSVNQVSISPVNTKAELIEYCNQKGITTMCYAPLQQANLVKANNPALINELCSKYSKSIQEILLMWCCSQGIIPIPKSIKRERMDSNYTASMIKMSDEDIQMLSGLDAGIQYLPESMFCPGL